MSTTDILTACLQRMTTFAASYSPAYQVAWPGIDFTPPSTGVWLEAMLFPNEPENYGWGDSACTNAVGFFQVLVMFRPGAGIVNASEIADDLIAYFAKGTELGSVRVFQRPHQNPAVTEDEKIYIPVTIRYQGLT